MVDEVASSAQERGRGLTRMEVAYQQRHRVAAKIVKRAKADGTPVIYAYCRVDMEIHCCGTTCSWWKREVRMWNETAIERWRLWSCRSRCMKVEQRGLLARVHAYQSREREREKIRASLKLHILSGPEAVYSFIQRSAVI